MRAYHILFLLLTLSTACTAPTYYSQDADVREFTLVADGEPTATVVSAANDIANELLISREYRAYISYIVSDGGVNDQTRIHNDTAYSGVGREGTPPASHFYTMVADGALEVIGVQTRINQTLREQPSFEDVNFTVSLNTADLQTLVDSLKHAPFLRGQMLSSTQTLTASIELTGIEDGAPFTWTGTQQLRVLRFDETAY